MVPTVMVGDKEYEIPLLEPQDQLLFAYASAVYVKQLIDQKKLKYTAESLKKWTQEAVINDRMFYAIRNLLGKDHQLDEALACYKEAYLKHLLSAPEGQAVYTFCKGNPDARITGLNEEVIGFLCS